MKPKLLLTFFLFFTLLLFGGGRATATTDTLWKTLGYRPNNFSFSPDDSLFVIFDDTGYSQRLAITNSYSGTIDTIIKTPNTKNEIAKLSGTYSNDGTKLFCGGKRDIEVYNTATWEKLTYFEQQYLDSSSSEQQTINNIQTSKDGKKIIAAISTLLDINDAYRIWDIETGKIDSTFNLPKYSFDGKPINLLNHIYFGGENDEYFLTDGIGGITYPKPESFAAVAIYDRYADTVIFSFYNSRLLAISPDRTKFVFGTPNDSIAIYDLLTKTYENFIVPSFGWSTINDISISSDNKYMAIAYSINTLGIEVYDIQNKTLLKTILSQPILVYAKLALFSPQNNYLAGYIGYTYMFSKEIITDIAKRDDDTPVLQLYPNPSGNTVNFGINLPNAEKLTIKICDENGNDVKQLEDREFNTGNYIYNLSTDDLTSGMYIITLKSNSNVYTKKFIVKH